MLNASSNWRGVFFKQMEYLANILTKVNRETSRPSIEKLIDDLISLNQGIIIQEIWRRWELGNSVDGGKIGTYSKSPLGQAYAAQKNKQNPLAGYGNVDLTLSGALGENLTVKKQGGNYKIFSTDEKYQKIGAKYGFDEFGLTEGEMLDFLSELFSVGTQTILTKIYR